MFQRQTRDALGGRLYPWQRGSLVHSGEDGDVPMSGTPSATEIHRPGLWLHLRHEDERLLHTEDSNTDFIVRSIDCA